MNQIDELKEKIAFGQELTAMQRLFVLKCINETTAVETIVVDSRNYLGRIEHVWAFLSVDEGGEGVCAAPLGGGMLAVPMIAADEKRLDSLKPIARRMTKIFHKPVRLVKFTTREDVEVYSDAAII